MQKTVHKKNVHKIQTTVNDKNWHITKTTAQNKNYYRIPNTTLTSFFAEGIWGSTGEGHSFGQF